MVPGDCCFYIFCLNVHFHTEKKKTACGISSKHEKHEKARVEIMINNMRKTGSCVLVKLFFKKNVYSNF